MIVHKNGMYILQYSSAEHYGVRIGSEDGMPKLTEDELRCLLMFTELLLSRRKEKRNESTEG